MQGRKNKSKSVEFLEPLNPAYCRPVKELQEQPVGAGATAEPEMQPAQGTPLYMF